MVRSTPSWSTTVGSGTDSRAIGCLAGTGTRRSDLPASLGHQVLRRLNSGVQAFWAAGIMRSDDAVKPSSWRTRPAKPSASNARLGVNLAAVMVANRMSYWSRMACLKSD